ncbi:MAG: 30S ribosomal protein S16 [bacterium]|nr:30S ribosomal protein S16 [bacterium]
MLMIRLQRRGKKHQAAYRLVVGEKRSKLQGKQTDDLGWYEPHGNTHELNKEKITYWMSKGAQPSPTVNNLLIRLGIVKGKKIAVHNAPKKEDAAAKKPEVVKAA